MAFKQMNIKSYRMYSMFSRSISAQQHLRKNVGVGGMLLLSVPIATFYLGTWQVKRRTWKLNLIEQVKMQNKADPVDLPQDLEELNTMEYRRVKVQGRFDHTKELYIGPRQLMKDSGEGGGGLMSSRPQVGYLVITPFHLTERDMTILVNRGWVPRNELQPAKRKEGQVEDEIELIGTVRLPETRPQFCPKTQASPKEFNFRDVPKMTKLTGSEPVFIDADASSSINGGPIGGQTRFSFRNEHLSYIVTWYSLSAATACMWYRKYLHGVKFL